MRFVGLIAAALMFSAILPAQPLPYSTVFYDNAGLRLEAYLYVPAGTGPFPVVIFNHGSRASNERAEMPFFYIGRVLTSAGYAVLVPERRGYGKSEGKTFTTEIANDKGPRFITRMLEETDDVLASMKYLQSLPSIDTKHAAIMGWSFGGLVSVFGASKSRDFLAVIDEAGGSLSWRGSPALQKALMDAARQITTPILCLVAENDATTDAVQAVCNTVKKAGRDATLKIYPPFTPPTPTTGAPGHAVFGSQGVDVWRDDVLRFLKAHLNSR